MVCGLGGRRKSKSKKGKGDKFDEAWSVAPTQGNEDYFSNAYEAVKLRREKITASPYFIFYD